MTERPILFSGPMVRAILEGRKTQTRRVVKGIALRWLEDDGFTPEFVSDPGNRLCPYGKPGDRLWVRETFGHTKGNGIRTVYRADGEEPKELLSERRVHGMKWKPSIHMPRWASRITLEIKNIRAERLKDISCEDAVSEGIERINSVGPLKTMGWKDYGDGPGFMDPITSFQSLWNSINGAGSWALNPWVWIIEFERTPNETP